MRKDFASKETRERNTGTPYAGGLRRRWAEDARGFVLSERIRINEKDCYLRYRENSLLLF